jgi:predicted DNA-binding protein
MSGRREFLVRDEAFESLSKHLGNRKKTRISEAVENGIAYFWDWTPILKEIP